MWQIMANHSKFHATNHPPFKRNSPSQGVLSDLPQNRECSGNLKAGAIDISRQHATVKTWLHPLEVCKAQSCNKQQQKTIPWAGIATMCVYYIYIHTYFIPATRSIYWSPAANRTSLSTTLPVRLLANKSATAVWPFVGIEIVVASHRITHLRSKTIKTK